MSNLVLLASRVSSPNSIGKQFHIFWFNYGTLIISKEIQYYENLQTVPSKGRISLNPTPYNKLLPSRDLTVNDVHPNCITAYEVSPDLPGISVKGIVTDSSKACERSVTCDTSNHSTTKHDSQNDKPVIDALVKNRDASDQKQLSIEQISNMLPTYYDKHDREHENENPAVTPKDNEVRTEFSTGDSKGEGPNISILLRIFYKLLPLLFFSDKINHLI